MSKIKKNTEISNNLKKSTDVKVKYKIERSYSLKPDSGNYAPPPVSSLNGKNGKNKNNRG